MYDTGFMLEMQVWSKRGTHIQVPLEWIISKHGGWSQLESFLEKVKTGNFYHVLLETV